MKLRFENKDGIVSVMQARTVIFGGITAWAKTETSGTVLRPALAGVSETSAEWKDENGLSIVLKLVEYGDVCALRLTGSYLPLELPERGGDLHLAPDAAFGFDISSLGGMQTYLANYMNGAFWCSSFISGDLKSMPAETQSLLWKTRSKFTFASTVCEGAFKSDFRGNPDGGCTLYVWCNIRCNSCRETILTVGSGTDPYTLVPQVIGETFKYLKKPGELREKRRYPEELEYLGWCSWDAFNVEVSHENLLAKAKEFRDKGIPVRWFIIDDWWGDVGSPKITLKNRHSQELYSFEADKERFPYGLKKCIGDLKQQYGVDVGMWHPTTGFWSGIAPDGPLAAEYGDCLFLSATNKLIPCYDRDKAFRFYYAMHKFYKDCGTVFVKIDNQSSIKSNGKGLYPIGKAATELHEALEASVGVNFDGQMINCMCMSNENFWNRPQSSVCRLSGDFLPENRQWFVKHILQCSYNSLFQGSAYYTDWDMWWSDDGQGRRNAVLRSMSGGPIYMSDKLDRSIRETIMPVVYSDGRIIRLTGPALPTADCLMTEATTAHKPFKVFNRIGEAGVLAAFNLDAEEKPVSGTVSPADAIEGAEQYVMYDWYTREAKIVGASDSLPLTLKDYDDFRLYLFVPLGADGKAAFGLTDKYMSPATIESLGQGFYRVKDKGTFSFWSAKPLKTVTVNSKPVSVSAVSPNVYSVELKEAAIVRI